MRCAACCSAEYDEGGSIGRRYRRQDEIGTPWCVTVDHQSLEDRTVTVRDRDSLEQERLPIDELAAELPRRLVVTLADAEGTLGRRGSVPARRLGRLGPQPPGQPPAGSPLPTLGGRLSRVLASAVRGGVRVRWRLRLAQLGLVGSRPQRGRRLVGGRLRGLCWSVRLCSRPLRLCNCPAGCCSPPSSSAIAPPDAAVAPSSSAVAPSASAVAPPSSATADCVSPGSPSACAVVSSCSAPAPSPGEAGSPGSSTGVGTDSAGASVVVPPHWYAGFGCAASVAVSDEAGGLSASALSDAEGISGSPGEAGSQAFVGGAASAAAHDRSGSAAVDSDADEVWSTAEGHGSLGCSPFAGSTLAAESSSVVGSSAVAGRHGSELAAAGSSVAGALHGSALAAGSSSAAGRHGSELAAAGSSAAGALNGSGLPAGSPSAAGSSGAAGRHGSELAAAGSSLAGALHGSALAAGSSSAAGSSTAAGRHGSELAAAGSSAPGALHGSELAADSSSAGGGALHGSALAAGSSAAGSSTVAGRHGSELAAAGSSAAGGLDGSAFAAGSSGVAGRHGSELTAGSSGPADSSADAGRDGSELAGASSAAGSSAAAGRHGSAARTGSSNRRRAPRFRARGRLAPVRRIVGRRRTPGLRGARRWIVGGWGAPRLCTGIRLIAVRAGPRRVDLVVVSCRWAARAAEAGERGGLGLRVVLELLLGAEDEVEGPVAEALAADERDGTSEQCDPEDPMAVPTAARPGRNLVLEGVVLKVVVGLLASPRTHRVPL